MNLDFSKRLLPLTEAEQPFDWPSCTDVYEKLLDTGIHVHCWTALV